MPIRSYRFQVYIVALGIFLLHCQAHMKAPYPKNPNTIEPGSFLGPFSGQIQDSNGRAMSDVWLIAEWKYASDTQILPPKQDSYRLLLQTSVNGKYQIPKYTPPADEKIIRFALKAYKFGYEGYRSDILFEENLRRHDFTQQDNLIFLSPFPKDGSHKKHLIFLGCDDSLQHCEDPLPKIIEQELALASLEGNQPKISTRDALPEKTMEPTESLLEPSSKMPPQAEALPPFMRAKAILGAALKTLEAKLVEMHNPEDVFEIEDFADDINQVPFGNNYAGVHFKAKVNKQSTRDETKDVALRIWYPKELHQASAMFQNLIKKLNIKTIKPIRTFPSAQYGQIYDPTLKVYGAIIFSKITPSVLAKPHEIEIVMQLSCGKAICKTTKLLESLIFAIQHQIDSLTPQSGHEGYE